MTTVFRSPLQRFARWLARDAGFHAIALGLPLALLVTFLVARDLPLVDLPQHAAQIATWVRWDAQVPEIVGRYELNFRTPYLLAYPLARVLSPLVGPAVALKLVVWLAIVGIFGTAPVGLDAHVGSWWGYRRLDACSSDHAPRPAHAFTESAAAPPNDGFFDPSAR